MSSVKPITLYSHASGPNPWKVAILLEELSIPYETKFIDFADLKKPPYLEINPNGRVPAIQDPNTGITLWESGAINTYLIDTYDTDKKLTYTTSPEKYQVVQWLMFQMSGQGPYFGQAAWFQHFHPEKIPSAIDRYVKEIERVLGVLDSVLKDKEYLVGDGKKCTYADLAFITWGVAVPFLTKIDVAGSYPNYHRWMQALCERPAVKKVLEDKAKAAAASKH